MELFVLGLARRVVGKIFVLKEVATQEEALDAVSFEGLEGCEEEAVVFGCLGLAMGEFKGGESFDGEGGLVSFRGVSLQPVCCDLVDP